MSEKNLFEGLSLWAQNFILTHYFVDPDGFASIHGLAFFLQEVAHNHATARSLGFEDLVKDNKTWVLTRQVIKFYNFPFIRESIRVETWVQNTTPSFTVRDFHLLNSRGEIYGLARTSWMMLDIVQRRPVKIPDKVLALIPLTPGRLNEDLPLDKLQVLPVREVNNHFGVKYSDLDMNNHVNNITYIRWVSDDFDIEFRKKHQLNSIEMNYLNEALYGEQLTSDTAFNPENNSYQTTIRRTADKKEIAIARTFWKDKSN